MYSAALRLDSLKEQGLYPIAADARRLPTDPSFFCSSCSIGSASVSTWAVYSSLSTLNRTGRRPSVQQVMAVPGCLIQG